MAILGFANLVDTDLHSLWDLDEVRKVALAGGTTFDEVVREAQAVADAVSREALADPHMAGLFAIQDDVTLEYHIGGGAEFGIITEHETPDPQRGETKGHSLPINWYGGALGWTRMGLMDRRMMQIEADLRLAMTKMRNLNQRVPLTRLFKMEAEAVGGTSGASVPFADGGTADAGYVPPDSYQGKTFTSSHDHYLRVAALSTANVDAHILTLREHGIEGPYEIVIPEADAASWAALTKFRKPEWGGIIYQDTSSGTDRASLQGIEIYNGYYESPYGIGRIWQTPRLPTNYYGIYKTFGPGDPRNPLRMRIQQAPGYGWKLVPGTWVNQPHMMAVLANRMGYGVGEDRTNAVLVHIAGAGDYVTPTIS